MNFQNTIEFARKEDENDPLRHFRQQFYIPILNGRECIYFTGNSLGLQPRSAQEYVLDEMENWANYGVEGHFHGRNPWASFHEVFAKKLQPLVGASPDEIVVMNTLSVNLHLMLTTFFRPGKKRYKILCENRAFTSDYYVFDSQLRLHGLDPATALIEMKPRAGEFTLQTEDIVDTISKHGEELCLVILGGINYYTGQLFDLQAITNAAHKAGAYCGFDLAHAVGNVPLRLHDWDVDFACWCSYKYLNAGPGAIAGAFVHSRHVRDSTLPRLAGWWGTDKHERFQFKREFNPIPTAEGWQLSNANILSMAALKASLDIFEEAGFENTIRKGKKLSAFLIFVIKEVNKASGREAVKVLTPEGEEAHGSQVSLLIPERGRQFFDSLSRNAVIADWRDPNVIRAAPVPLYNTFEEVFRFGQVLMSFTKEAPATS